MNHNTFFSALFTLFITLFTLSACDDGGGENNNNLTVDQDVKDWCAETLYCSDDGWGGNIPYKTQEDCEQIMQWVKNHRNDSDYYYESCLTYTLNDSPINCLRINDAWAPSGECAQTPFVCDTNCPGEK